jgi:hypothetical protein
MRYRLFALVSVLAVVIGVALVASISIAGQGSGTPSISGKST